MTTAIAYADLNLKRIKKGLLLYTKSEIFKWEIERTIRQHHSITKDAIVEITSANYLETMKLLKQYRFDGSPWLVIARNNFIRTSTIKTFVRELDKIHAIFLIFVPDYKSYKQFKQNTLFAKHIHCDSINYMCKDDIVKLYGDTLSQLDFNVAKFVYRNYCNELDTIFELRDTLKRGTVYANVRDLISDFGIGSTTTNFFVVTLLRPIDLKARKKALKKPRTDEEILQMGVTTKRKQLFAIAYNLLPALGYRTFYNFVLKSIDSLINLRLLTVTGIILTQHVPDYEQLANLNYDVTGIRSWYYMQKQLEGATLHKLLKLRVLWTSKGVPNSELDLQLLIYRVTKP